MSPMNSTLASTSRYALDWAVAQRCLWKGRELCGPRRLYARSKPREPCDAALCGAHCSEHGVIISPRKPLLPH